MMKKVIVLFVCLLSLHATNVMAGREKVIASLSGSQIKPYVASPGITNSLAVEDQKWSYISAANNWVCRFGDKQQEANVVLRFDDTHRNFDNSNWTLQVTYNVSLSSLVFPGTTSQAVSSTVLTGEVATINFNPTAPYKDVFVKTYAGYYKAEVTITNVVWTPTSGPVQNVVPAKYAYDIFFDVTQETERYYNMAYNGINCNAGTMSAPKMASGISAIGISQSSLTRNELPVSWDFIEGAESYDLEWLFVDIGSASFSSLYNLDFSYATRVNLPGNDYRIPMSYPRGVIVYRVRAVGNSHEAPYTKRIEGPWSVDGTNTLALSSPNASSFMKHYDGLDPDYNWQYSAAYAEDGKRKETIQYFDGSLRSRQAVTVLNSDDNVVIGETKYDHQGRASVQMIPTPYANSGIHFYSNFNPGFSKEQFDVDANFPASVASPAVVPAGAATADYYGNNTSATGTDALVPNAQGVPYTQTRYATDGTGRVIAQSGVGPDHKLGGGHDTRYVYGRPGGQEELDRLFGNEVGNVSHYKKNLAVDPNGQTSISYLDQEGRVIATALSGLAPANMLDIDNKPASVPMDVVIPNGESVYADLERSTQSSFVTTVPNTSYTFDYSLNILETDTACYSYLLNPNDPAHPCKICEDCVFDVAIRITDKEGNNLAATINNHTTQYNGGAATVYVTNASGGGQNPLIRCEQVEQAHFNITVVFPSIGAYTIEKILKVNRASLELAKQNLKVAVQTAPCGPLTENATVAPCNNCEYICNKQYGVYAPTYITPSVPVLPAPVTTDRFGQVLSTLPLNQQTQAQIDQRTQALSEYNSCFNNCTNIGITLPDECTLKANALFRDMSPGGQYFDNLQDQINTCNPSLVCNPSDPSYNQSACINGWLTNLSTNNPDFSWSGFYAFATNNTNCSPHVTASLSTFSDWNWIRSNWQSCFAKYLLKFHPEYCNFNFYCGGTLICTLPGDIESHQKTIPVFADVNGSLGTVNTGIITMNHSNLYDKLFTNDQANLFCMPVYPAGTGAGAYISDLKTSPTVLTNFVLSAYADPIFQSENNCSPLIYCDRNTTTSASDVMKKALYSYYSASVNGGANTIPMSIWYVLDDPDNIRSITSTSFPVTGSSYLPSGTTIDQATLDMFQAYHGTNGILAGSSKYDVFKNYYQGEKKFILYALYSTNYNCAGGTINNDEIRVQWSVADPNEEGFTSCTFHATTNTLPHAQIRFPQNTIFEMMLSDCPNFMPSLAAISQNTATALANACQASCEGNAAGWVADIKNKIAACALGSAASASLTVLSAIEHDLTEICVSSCDATNMMGLDHIPALPVNPNLPSGVLTFNDVINYRLNVAPYNTCSGLLSSISIVHPPQAATSGGYSQAACICESIKDFAIGQSLVWDLSNPNLPSLIATAMNNQLDPVNTITSSDVCVWMAQCYQGSGSCTSSGTPPMNINYLIVPTGSGITNQPVPAVLVCPATDEIPPADPCDPTQAQADADYGNGLAAQQALKELTAAFETNYIKRCLDNSNATEFLKAQYTLHEYNYTLYYYDQAGNLIKTVPPEGVLPLVVSQTANPSAPTTKDVALYRSAPGSHSFIWPDHKLVTNYKYNTLNTIRESVTPDAGKSNFYYDRVGRLAISQNAKQAAYSFRAYSYTIYDELSRVQEVGELMTSTIVNDDLTRDQGALAGFLYTTPYYNRRQISRTYYDEAPTATFNGGVSSPVVILSKKMKGVNASGTQGTTRGRVTGRTYIENDFNAGYGSSYNANTSYYDNASFYCYDMHGNVKTLYVENTHLNSLGYDLNKIDYDYDLVSGKVNKVFYNTGKPDQFYHRYEYDADNRITAAYTSRNNIVWEKEAKYFYYKHGPLARVELGDKQVQATDYAYTIHGWIKGVNSNSLDRQNDIGKDGYVPSSGLNLNKPFAEDAYGYSLGYYANDYKAKNPSAADFMANQSNITGILYPSTAGQGAELFNGNIANMTTNQYLQPTPGVFSKSPIVKTFRYDQMNRIKSVYSFDNLSGNTWNSSGSAFTNKYREAFSYDFNGNITYLDRYNKNAAQIDQLDYKYNRTAGRLDNNRLNYVADNPSLSSTDPDDIDDQTGLVSPASGLNYAYDPIGNLEADASNQISAIAWTVYGKIKSITRSSGTKPNLEYVYDGAGNRIEKILKPQLSLGDPTTFRKTHYVRDAVGNVMSVYEQETISGTERLTLKEQHVYGSSRLGMIQDAKRVDANSSVIHSSLFDNGSLNGWVGDGTAALTIDANYRMKVAAPGVTNAGARYDLSGLTPGKTYEITFDADIREAGYNPVTLVAYDNPATNVFNPIASLMCVQGSNSLRITPVTTNPVVLRFINPLHNTFYIYYLDNIRIREVEGSRELGEKAYELSNHLGNVLTTVSDRKLAVGGNCNGLSFDGNDDYATIPHNSNYNFGAGDFTIEARIKASNSQVTSYPAIISSRVSNYWTGFVLYLFNGTLTMYINGYDIVSAPTDIRDNAWHHVAVTRSGSTVTLFIDGASVATGSSSGNMNSGNPLLIGEEQFGPSLTTFKGNIGEMRLWNMARSQTALNANKSVSLLGSETGLVGYWPLDEGTGQTLADHTANANTATRGANATAASDDPSWQTVTCMNPVADHYTADILSSTDYYAFGAPMQGRQFNSPDYRYGFNGKENDPESVGEGEGTQDYGLRIYNPSLGKFFSTDPLTEEYPWNSTYAFAENSPIAFIDLDGAERFYTADGKLIGSMGNSVQVRKVNEEDVKRITLFISLYDNIHDNGVREYLKDKGKEYSSIQLWETFKAWDKSLEGGYDGANTGGELGGEYGFHHGGKQLLFNTWITVGTMGAGTYLTAGRSILAIASWEVLTKAVANRGDLTKIDWADVIIGTAAKKIGVQGDWAKLGISALKESINSVVDLKVADGGFRVGFINKEGSQVFIDLTFGAFKTLVGQVGDATGAEKLSTEQMKMVFDQMKTQLNQEIKKKNEEK